MSPPQYQWRAARARGTPIHKTIVGEPRTLCGILLTQVPCQAPIDPRRPKDWPVNACRRCRRSNVPWMEEEIDRLVQNALQVMRQRNT